MLDVASPWRVARLNLRASVVSTQRLCSLLRLALLVNQLEDLVGLNCGMIVAKLPIMRMSRPE